MRTRSPKTILSTLAAVTALTLSACGGDEDPLADDSSGDSDTSGDKGSLVVGGQDFYELQIMSSMYQLLLEDAGYTVDTKLVSTRDVYLPELQNGTIDIVPEYAGSITDALQLEANGPNAEQVSSNDIGETMDALQPLLEEQGLTALEPAEATDQNAFAVTQDFAEENDLETLSDLGEMGQPITLAAAEDCASRPDCKVGLEKTYGLEIEKVLPTGFGTPQTIKSVTEGESELGLVATSDGSLEQQGLVILEDDKGLQVAQNLVPVVSQEVLDANPDIADTLNALSDELTTDDLADLNVQVAIERQKPEDVAQQYLEDNGLL
ncbi:MAG TPA: ABC transporter substrate-binding protein [Nocardioidaceae bacterium]|jgi:osmoprotectant transport system substrate-binding protein|nr:ABC transporter substrate-binding protein [Nocardioidaceae bacterium]